MTNRTNNILVITVISIMLMSCGGGGGGGDETDSSITTSTASNITASHQVLAFNDLGMHCADLDYSVFSILPPFNVVNAQVIERGDEPRILDNTQVSVSYRGVADISGSINTTSQNQAGGIWKTNFWDHVNAMFGFQPAPDEGLVGQKMPGISNSYSANDPQPFGDFNTTQRWFVADGVPIMPIDDAGQSKPYPLMRISATDKTSGATLANLDVVLPVASEADCQNCHAIDEIGANSSLYPSISFEIPSDINDPINVSNAAKHNILALHDYKHSTNLVNETPVLCARCHYSAALDLSGAGAVDEQVGNPTMSNVMHEYHGQLIEPATSTLVFPSDGTLNETCYQCHPGKVTQCLRGAMGNAGIECKECHGDMLAVGSTARLPWLDEPRCESCHTGDALSNLTGESNVVVNTVDSSGNVDNIRLRQAYLTIDPTAEPIIANNKRFAEDDGTLYRNSLGHNGVACEACHGSTHAIWPTAAANDNVAATQLQGHAGAISDCAVCHTSLPLTLDGPHGMHNVNSSSWNLRHESFYERNPNSCRVCHGANLEGTVLSRTAADRVYLRDDDGATISVAKGTPVRCNMCHRTP